MVLKNIAYKAGIAVFCACLLAPQAKAEGALQPFNLRAKYVVAWSGITIGRINITAKEDGTSYSLMVDTKTKGLGALFSDESSVVTSKGSKRADGTYIPAEYTSRAQKKEDQRATTTLTFDGNGNIATRSREPEDDPTWRPRVTNDEINTARDPVTASFILRRQLHDAINNKTMEVSNRTYDGARLATMKMTRAANAKVEIMGTYQDTVNVHVNRTPVSGYTPKEIKKFNKGDPEIHLYFSNDDAFLPVRASVKVTLGELSLTMVEKYAQ